MRIEGYCNTNLELLKLKTIDKIADVLAVLLSRTLLLIALSFFMLFINIGLFFWIGEFLGKAYYGFAAVGGFYFLVCVVFIIVHKVFVRKMKNTIISHLLN